MVTFRNNNNGRRNNFRRNDRNFKSIMIEINSHLTFLIMKIFKEKYQIEIITMHPSL